MKNMDIVCAICEHKGSVELGDSRSVREGFKCPNCRSSLRFRDQAQVILDEFADGECLSIDALVQSGKLDNAVMLEPALGGPFRRRLSKLAGYHSSYYWEDIQPGEERNGIRCEDLRQLTFSTSMFDLVITSDVFEHVFEPYKAFSEIHRVLKPGGVHVCSIPVKWPLPPRSQTRAILVNGAIEHLLEPVYHRAGDGSNCIVVTDWGADLVIRLDEIGFKTNVVRRSSPVRPWYTNATFVSRKL